MQRQRAVDRQLAGSDRAGQLGASQVDAVERGGVDDDLEVDVEAGMLEAYGDLGGLEHHPVTPLAVAKIELNHGSGGREPLAIDVAGHPALFMVDTISSLASVDYRHDEWQVDVTVSGSQKGLMLPPGLSFNAVSGKALAASKSARLPRSYWDWQPRYGSRK